MAAIGAIRKHGILLMVIIGFALLAFLIGDFNKLSSVLSDKNTNGKKVNPRNPFGIKYLKTSTIISCKVAKFLLYFII